MYCFSEQELTEYINFKGSALEEKQDIIRNLDNEKTEVYTKYVSWLQFTFLATNVKNLLD